MRTFDDVEGRAWVATVAERPGPDYKGRFHLRLVSEADVEPGEVDLLDIRWNSRDSASRTLETMSLVELRRRLRQALGRASTALPGFPVNGAG